MGDVALATIGLLESLTVFAIQLEDSANRYPVPSAGLLVRSSNNVEGQSAVPAAVGKRRPLITLRLRARQKCEILGARRVSGSKSLVRRSLAISNTAAEFGA